MKKGNIELIPKKLELFVLIFTVPLSQIYSQSTKLISKLENSKIKTRKGLSQKKMDLRMFCEKLPL